MRYPPPINSIVNDHQPEHGDHVITLQNEQLEAAVAPTLGAAVIAFNVHHRGDWLPLRPDLRRQPDFRYAETSFLLAPYSNRIRGGRFTFDGRTYQLNTTNDHAMHGDIWYRSWRVVTQTATELTCALNTRNHPHINWPWHFAIQVTYQLDGNRLRSRLAMTNLDSTPMPAGLGWHPYFSRSLTATSEPVVLTLQTSRVYPDGNDDRMPSGDPIALPPELDFTRPAALTTDTFIDHCFTGYDGRGRIEWTKSGIALDIACSDNLDHLVIYNPTDRPYFAIEPVSNANNAINLAAGGGMVRLDPADTLSAAFDMMVGRF